MTVFGVFWSRIFQRRESHKIFGCVVIFEKWQATAAAVGGKHFQQVL